MTQSQRDQLIERNVEALGISIEEATQMVLDDEVIDKGGRCEWEPSVEEEREMRKNTKLRVERKKTTRKPKEKEPDMVKRDVISAIFEALQPKTDKIEMTNVEKTIDFEINGEKYSINLTKHRK